MHIVGSAQMSQAKILTAAQAQQLIGAQILVQPTQTAARMVHPQLITG